MLDSTAAIKTSKFQCLQTTKAYSCSHYIVMLVCLEVLFYWYLHLGTQADGSVTLWNIDSYCGRRKSSPRGSQLTIKFSVRKLYFHTWFLGQNRSYGPTVLGQFRTCNPKMGLEVKETYLLKSSNDKLSAQRSVPDGRKYRRMLLWHLGEFSK